MNEANPKFCFDHFAGVGWGSDYDKSISFTSEETTLHRDKSNSIDTLCLTFYGRFSGRNGIARLSGKVTIYFSDSILLILL